ncbi:hypothetical protein D9757_012785 [Collybiopsis confluens]|uniref:Cytosol aminopeptidase domain-containing protein n=1 Tax=Collybiopsis confluens TaxID=2823264 RepID=A0A8H5CWQ7_9AGAR|nr:hypothetical protein D9757_012785 [Collybiopsis confluens]
MKDFVDRFPLDWAASRGLNTFLSVTHGTDEPAKFLEIHYKGAPQKDAQPVAFVGKGITFDSGGISLKPGENMKLMRGDMGGAGAVVSATLAIAKLKLPVNIVTVAPLTENMPGPSATKPGDIIYAMNGKSVEVDNTDAEGRLTSDELWERLNVAGEHEFDRFWRMPLNEDYGTCSSGGRPAGSATAALFLKAFAHGIETEDGSNAATAMKWAHLDIAGAKNSTRPLPYQEIGMTGRPTRALIEYVRGLGN